VPLISSATRGFYNRIAVVFDGTLAPDSYRSLLESIGVDAGKFSKERVRPLVDDGWEEILTKLYCLIEESKGRDDVAVTKEHLARVGRETELYEGVPEMFGRVRERAREVVPDVEVEFYLLTSGIAEIPRATPVAGEFEEIWGCAVGRVAGGKTRGGRPWDCA
jgi:hypothetical protein